ncbi:MAG: hypothetical protein A2677_03995 [Candidatus Komeilibacteria bacterium RIFCSPHIGHO2_01_FULL_52_14]|uniref:Uncharacterized protein n=1 Tax=Candidatus Komeilibacteria bacterium RIFCSPHIGHO2_01_FULL_52_14 TaxID=1798549 RepID=A0A1G2BMS9_9BACT|nr:MAG: hypothetical protein A2677_03995 [Candidatus Komeilibacteria bacterium RIFCSPHIGHO2_01_FULL_52_14]
MNKEKTKPFVPSQLPVVQRLRRRRTIGRQARLFARPAITATLMVCVWTILRRFGVHLDKQDEQILSNGVIPTLGVVYGIMAAHVLSTVWKEYKLVEYCVTHNDFQKFMEIRDVRIPQVIHSLLATLATTIVICFLALDYRQFAAGFISIYSITFVMILYQTVAVQLDNPFTGLWNVRVPQSWMAAKPGEKNRPSRNRTDSSHADCEPK